MSASDIWSILGLIATIGFGILGYVVVRNKRYPGKITFVRQSKISLFNNIAKNFNEISISYMDSPIRENVIYIKASFINDGDIDIEGKNVEIPISLDFKTGFKWIKSIITSSSDNLSCSSIITNDGSNLEFNFGLFRKKEFFQFEALIETTDKGFNSDNVFENIEFKHRISNTQKISSTELLNDEQIKKKKGNMKSSVFTFGLQMIILLGFLVVQIFIFKSTTIQYVDNYKNEYKATAKTDNTVELENIITKEEKIVTFDEFCNKLNLKPILPTETKWQQLKNRWYIIPMYLALIGFLLLIDYLQVRKANKLNRILQNEKK